VSWLAGMAVITSRCCGQPSQLRRMGYEKFLAAVRRELPRWGGKFVRHSIVQGLWEALADMGGVAAQRPGALERLHLLLEDWRLLRARLADTEERMTALLGELGLTELVTSIDGMSALSGAVILAELTSGLVMIGARDYWDGVAAGVVIVVAVALDELLRSGVARTLARASSAQRA